MAGVFVSYRRDDSQGFAGRLSDDLGDILGEDRVFRDIEGIRGGADFGDVIHQTLGKADAVIVLIGVAGSMAGFPALDAVGAIGVSLLIAKIEKPQAVERIEPILEAVDGVMVARGDLGVEMLPEAVVVAVEAPVSLDMTLLVVEVVLVEDLLQLLEFLLPKVEEVTLEYMNKLIHLLILEIFSFQELIQFYILVCVRKISNNL